MAQPMVWVDTIKLCRLDKADGMIYPRLRMDQCRIDLAILAWRQRGIFFRKDIVTPKCI